MDELTLESEIADMYAQYKRSRDVIDQDVYFELRRCAREAIESSRLEHDIQQISKLARNMNSSHNANQSEPVVTSQGIVARLADQFMDLFAGGGKGLSIVAGICVVAIGIGIGVPRFSVDNAQPVYSTVAFVNNSQLLEELIASNNEWLYGFSANTRPTTKAFRAGELVIDMNIVTDRLKGLSPQVIDQRLRSHAPFADKSVSIAMRSPSDIKNIELKLTEYYSANNAQLQMFRFGQWIQYHYLLSRLALADSGANFYAANYMRYPELLSGVDSQLRELNVLSEDDLNGLKVIPNSNLSIVELDKISNLLLRVRTLLLYG